MWNKWAPGRGQFWPHGYNLNKLGRSPLGKATCQISKTWALWFQSRRFLKGFPMLVYVKIVGPWAGPFLAQWPQFKQSWQRSTRWNCISNIKDLGIMVSVKKIFKCFPNVSLCKTCWPLGGAIFCPQGYNLNNLARCLLDEATYQISKPWAFWFQTRRFLKVFLYKGLCITCDS